jgi:hypothetical protein
VLIPLVGVSKRRAQTAANAPDKQDAESPPIESFVYLMSHFPRTHAISHLELE